MSNQIQNLSFAIYRLPRSTDVEIIKGDIIPCDGKIAKNNFIFADFIGNRFCFKNHFKEKLSLEHFTKEYQLEFDLELLSNYSNFASTTEYEYEKHVKIGINAILSKSIDKVVFSKIKVQKNHISDLKHSFLSLSEAYPETLVCMFYTPKFGFWIGASPEVLLESSKDFIRTVALAGTQQSMGKLSKDAVWSQKEIEEQALVCRYIVNCFKKIRLREYDETGPKTIHTGKLFHLKTDYYIKKSEVNIPNLEEQLLDLLHPTSAVCGMPKKEAILLIKSHENHERKLYTGFWGPTCEEGFKFFVNIRVAQLFQSQIVFYAGAGITEDSDPHAEWAETEAKCDNLALKLMN